MEINVNQKKISIGDKYTIFTDGVQTHTASKGIFQLLAEIKLFKVDNPQPVITINKRLFWIKPKYNITTWDSSVYQFRTISFWKMYCQCQCGPATYDIYGHRGRKYSIFKNNKQVAWLTKKSVTWFNGDNYTIVADNNADAGMLTSFCLIIDNWANSDGKNKGAINIDFGNLGLWAKKFDNTWQPKI